MSLFHLNYLIFQKYDKKELERIALATSWEEQLEYVYYRALLPSKVLIRGYVHATLGTNFYIHCFSDC